MQILRSAAKPLLLGIALGVLGALVLVMFAGAFEHGATWSPVNQHGGPGAVFVVGPALAGWFWVAAWVERRGLAALGEALARSALAALAAGAVGLVLAQRWPAHPAVLESLFSTIGVALVVSSIASVSVRLATEPNLE